VPETDVAVETEQATKKLCLVVVIDVEICHVAADRTTSILSLRLHEILLSGEH
jgi:hypothetical protein